jgi:hypothetical protein
MDVPTTRMGRFDSLMFANVQGALPQSDNG